ncbi:unnamed protein product [Blepharisma stoltei]|uniref:Calcium-dependent protein kinase 1 n=1 Tax=Blepharisma stoltei TaxID=1481888 RepID=A0AAU9JT16_9CILI|nr:unnamed protein product [Blepharisma stoltei]
MGCCQRLPVEPDEIKQDQSKDTSFDKAAPPPKPFISDSLHSARPSDISLKIHRKQFVHHRDAKLSDFYQILDIIGDGGSSIVYKAVCLETGLHRAIKVFRKRGNDYNLQDSAVDEMRILRNLDHPNIIKIIELIENDQTINIVTELCTGGELFERIVQNRNFSENAAANWMYQILSGLIACHGEGIVHRDIKPENILFQDKTDTSILKIIDFGIATKIQPEENVKQFVGSSYYVAPEVIEGNYDTKCDIWSCGIILYIMLSGYPPFNGTSEAAIFTKIKRGVFTFSGAEWAHISKEAKSIIKRMLTSNPIKRPTAKELINDPWIRDRTKNIIDDNIIQNDTLENISSFHANRKLQQATLAFIASHLMTTKELDDLRKIFVALDKNGDGKLSINELKHGFMVRGLLSIFNVDEILEHCDSNENGYIDYNEFLTAALNWKKALSQERLETAFRAYDKDKNGKISVDEIKEFLGESSKEVSDGIWQQIFKQADLNNDGVLDLEEFKVVMLKHIADQQ